MLSEYQYYVLQIVVCSSRINLTVVPRFTATMLSRLAGGSWAITSLRAMSIPSFTSGDVGVLKEARILSFGLVSLNARSMATASVLVPPI